MLGIFRTEHSYGFCLLGFVFEWMRPDYANKDFPMFEPKTPPPPPKCDWVFVLEMNGPSALQERVVTELSEEDLRLNSQEFLDKFGPPMIRRLQAQLYTQRMKATADARPDSFHTPN